ncbi:MAG: acyl-CoA dehydrogenase [Candidatus Marinimicrobia bacterium]|nr:acyl-CoA dehydrogenase [Candidatus Neomarinimicrobiota bacterium]MCF7830145.1 acyl-CoA dehydrogenase [Candidatus Neomarinimicrobiota bacterium]MCF7882222.1 acyl-CoA dehydrogenase [Candidatus Neomarinimicrobiota bacterium]
MSGYFNEQHKMIRDMVRDFAQNEVEPIAAELDQTERFPTELVEQMGELGLMGIPYPEEYGGAGMDTISYALAIEELTKACSSTAITMAAHTSLGTFPIFRFGTDEQKQKYLPKMTSGEWLGAFGLTEPQAGSDASGTQTTAVPDGDEWVVNGGKMFMTNGGEAGVIVFTAVTDPDAKGSDGISCFVVEAGTPGLVIGKKEKKMGWRASDTRQVHFEDMRIPKENLLGEINRGYAQFMETLDGGRISIAAMGLGLAEAAFEASRKYVNEREAFGKKIKRFQGVSFPLADMRMKIEAAHHLTYNAARLKDEGKDFKLEAGMAKLYTSELATWATNQAVQTHGGYGYIKDFPVERYFRDAKVLEIGEGTSEIQRLIIAREVLKE